MKANIGTLITMGLGYAGKDKLEVVCMSDDGTRGNHLMFYLNNQPTNVLPLMNQHELAELIFVLIHHYKYLNFDMGLIDEGLKANNLK